MKNRIYAEDCGCVQTGLGQLLRAVSLGPHRGGRGVDRTTDPCEVPSRARRRDGGNKLTVLGWA